MIERERAELISRLRTTGVDVFDFEREVLHTLPFEFLLAYEVMWARATGGGEGRGGTRSGDAGKANARRVTRVSTGQVETRGGAKAGGKRAGASGQNVIVNEQALRMKQRVDRKLRAITRELRVWLHGDDTGSKSGIRRCSKCHKFAEDTWVWCPWDGARTEEMN